MVLHDKHYTNSNISELLVSCIDEKEFDCIIEPAAGDGSIINKLNHDNIIAYDIMPDNNNIIKQDYLKLDTKNFYGNILTIGNPPFGYRAQLAIEFFNKASEYSDVISFILPKSFRKTYIQNQLNIYFHLEKDIDIPINSFYTGTKVRCCIQVWRKKSYKRKKILLDNNSEDFSVVSQGLNFNREDADFSIRRTGYGIDVGKIYNLLDSEPITQFIFIKIHNKGVREKLEQIRKELYNFSYNSTGISPTFTIGELYTIYNKNFRRTLF